ncbi:hypothetical protein V866_007176 [Kwoniella sp. B9012]
MFTCISCRVAFETAAEQRSHFSTDWHRYNMKRRVANLPPVAAESFNEKVLERREQNAVRTDPRSLSCASCNSNSHADQSASQIPSQPSPHSIKVTHPATDTDSEDDSEEEEEGDFSARIAKAHQDILLDLPGLLSYLGEKVAVGNLCLYCPNGGREFGSLEAVRKHMIDKAHCKLAYEMEEDRAELADFYDFAGPDEMAESDWEDMEDSMSDVMQENAMPDKIKQQRQISLAPDGLSLMLPSGRTLGHRSLKVYYSQRLRPLIQHDTSTSAVSAAKVALVRQRLADPSLALVPVAGGHGAFGRGQELMKARNAGEAKWAKRQGRSFKDQRLKEQFKTKVGYVHNNQKHFRDPLLQ